MSKAAILDLVNTFSFGQLVDPAAGRYYDEAVRGLAPHALLTEATLVEVTEDDATYEMPTTVLTLLRVFYDDIDLVEDQLEAVEAIAAEWRQHRGSPLTYILAEEDELTLRLYPIPDRPSKAFSFVMGAPLGLDYPESALLVLHTTYQTNTPEWLDVPLLLRTLALDYGRESAHRDPMFSAACHKLADLTLTMVS